jgi:methyl-accepting chemotaxis protein
MFKDAKLATRVLIGFAAALLITLVVGFVGRRAVIQNAVLTGEIADNRLPSLYGVEEMQVGMLHAASGYRGLALRRMMEPQSRQANFAEVDQGLKLLDQGRRRYEALPMEPQESEIWRGSLPWLTEWQSHVRTMVDLHRHKDTLVAQGLKLDDPQIAQVDQRAFEEMARARESRNRLGEALEQLVRINHELAVSAGATVKDTASHNSTLLVALIGAALAIVGLVAVTIVRSIRRTLAQLLHETQRLTEAAIDGQLTVRGDVQSVPTEFRGIVIGVNETLDAVIGPLNVAADYVDRISKGTIPSKITDHYNGDFNTIKTNLNLCIEAVNLLVTDAGTLSRAAVEGKLATRADAAKHHGDFRKIVQGVNDTLDSVIGPLNVAADYVDRISKGNIPPKISDHYNGDFNTIKNNLNQCIDAVNLLVSDASVLSKAAVDGKLATRADTSKHHGDFRKIVEGVNHTLDSVIGPLNVAADYVDRISKGNIPAKITDKYSGDFNTIKDNLNQCIDAINLLVSDAGVLSKAAVDGKLATRADAAKHQGDFRKIVQGVNDTLDSVIGPLNVAAEYVDRISKGQIPDKITSHYNGDFNTIKNNLNQCIDAVNLLVTDASALAHAAVEGKLATRADATRHQGDFRKIVQGVNDTLDSVIGPLNVAAEYVDRISKGNIPIKITDQYNGDFNTLKNNLNQCIDAVNSLVSDAQLLAQAAVEGRLSTRADVNRHSGDFRRIVEGVNRTLDSVIDPVMEATQVLENLSQYDLRARVQGEYSGDHARIKTALNTTATALNDALAQVAESVEQLSEAARQIASSSQSVAQGASEQASSLEETSSSLEEMSGMTKQNADNTIQARTLAQSTKEAAEKGGLAMTRMMDAMEKIRSASEGTSQIIKDINEIAFQTNLLALNAAVEAARAGDAGRGFAVVAEEVRSLALRSKEAAKKTEDLIKMSVGHAENGQLISSEVAGSLSEIVSAASKVNDIVSEIAVASQEQSRGIEQVNLAVSEMDKVVQVSAANAEESSSAAEELSSQTEELTGLVSRFQLEREQRHNAPRRDAQAAELRRRSTASVPARRVQPSVPQRTRTNVSGPRKSTAEDVIPFAEDPGFKDF